MHCQACIARFALRIHNCALPVPGLVGAESAVLSPAFPWNQYTFLTISIERAPPDLNARLFRHGYLFARQFGIADTLYVHSTHPRAAQVAANASFVQGAAKCRNGQMQYKERAKLLGVKCPSVFGCCAFPGYPQETTSYLGAPAGSSRGPRGRTADGTIQMKAAISAAMPYF